MLIPPEFPDLQSVDVFNWEEGANFKLRIVRQGGATLMEYQADATVEVKVDDFDPIKYKHSTWYEAPIISYCDEKILVEW